MRTFAIGDIHGCLTALDTLLLNIQLEPGDVLVTLGDYINRGPNSSGVLDRLWQMFKGGQLVPLLGNHEQMLLEKREAIGNKVPRMHWDFLTEACQDYHETETHFFVHANAYPDIPLDEQPIHMLRWERFDDPPAHLSGKIMVCGHTAQENHRPRNIGHAVCIDTGAYAGGWLTCLEVMSGVYWQANQRGAMRMGELPQPEDE